MAYSRNTWVCGDVISAQKLNNIEDGIEEALECCGGDAGYSCEDGWEEIWSHEFDNLQQVYGHDYYAETVSHAIYLPNTIKVEINSEEYVLEGVQYGAYGDRYYGAPISFDQHSNPVPDFSGEYQFSIASVGGEGVLEIILYVPSDGDYDVTISEVSTIITTTECFQAAVKSVGSTLIVDYDPNVSPHCDKTFAEIMAAIESEQIVVLRYGNDSFGYEMFSLSFYDATQIVFTYNEVFASTDILSHDECVVDSSDNWSDVNQQYSLTRSV